MTGRGSSLTSRSRPECCAAFRGGGYWVGFAWNGNRATCDGGADPDRSCKASALPQRPRTAGRNIATLGEWFTRVSTQPKSPNCARNNPKERKPFPQQPPAQETAQGGCGRLRRKRALCQLQGETRYPALGDTDAAALGCLLCDDRRIGWD